jgi:hypothetical protein
MNMQLQSYAPHTGPAPPCNSLLLSPIQNCCLFTGKILTGYLDAPESLGLGNNNPITKFTSDITMCAMTNEGGTAKIVWGFRNGRVTIITTQKVISIARGHVAANIVRCNKCKDCIVKMSLNVLWTMSFWNPG